MKVDTFITLYNAKKTDDEKLNFIKEHVLNVPVSYSTKVDRAGLIAKTAYHQKRTGADGVEQEVFYQNSAAKYMLYSLTIVDLYTDLDIDFKESLDTFEKINGEILDTIVNSIDERELKELRMLLEFACDDIMTNEYEFHAFIREQVERFSVLLGSVMAPIIEKMDIQEVLNALEQLNQ